MNYLFQPDSCCIYNLENCQTQCMTELDINFILPNDSVLTLAVSNNGWKGSLENFRLVAIFGVFEVEEKDQFGERYCNMQYMLY